MGKLGKTAFVAAAATGFVFGGSATAAADTGSAGYFGTPHCLLQSLLTYGTISAGDAGAFLPGCAPF